MDLSPKAVLGSNGRLAIAAAMVLGVMVAAPGCAVGAWLADSVAGGERRVKVEADYEGLAEQRVAVLAAADQRTLFYTPGARERIVREVSAGIAEHVPGTTLTDPGQVADFKRRNDHWAAMRASRLLDVLEVDRVVLIDLVEYRTREPGNQHVWRGQVTGNVAVHAADADDPDNPVYYRTIGATYPEDDDVGVVNPDTEDETIELGMVKVFGRDVARLFYNHEVRR